MGHAAICDFGLSGFATDDNTSNASSSSISKGGAGTMRYAAPELLKTDVPRYTTSSDVWSFGCVAAEVRVQILTTHHAPIDSLSSVDSLRMRPIQYPH